jgi:PAS domain S-box-containing protein
MNLRTTYFSPSVKHMLGYTVEEALTQGWGAILTPGSFKTASKAFQEVLASENEDEKDQFRSRRLELELICKDGSSVWTESIVNLPRGLDGQPSGLLCISRDIVERRRAHELFSTLANNTPIGVFITQDGKFQFVNRQLQEYTGYEEDELIGIDGIRFVFPRDRNAVIANAVKMLKGEHTSPYVYRFIKKDREIRWVMGRVTSIQYNGRRAALGSFMDITEHKQAEQELRRSALQLRLLSKRIMEAQEGERGRIARELHDELGQQLFVLRMETESLAERVEDSPDLRNRVSRLLTLADELRATSQRIAVRIRPGVLEELGLVKAIQWFVEDFERRSGISCPVEAPGSNVVTSKGTAISAYRILQEALINVWRHSKASQVKVKISAEGDTMAISVIDNGVGVDLKKLSDRGSLGLLGMRERARLVSGTLTVQSKPGRGMRVTARLPMHADHTAGKLNVKL